MADLTVLLDTLQKAAENPRRQMEKYLSQGKKVVGCFPVYTPEELIHASGMIPMGLWGGRTELRMAKAYLPAFACPIMQSTLELGLRGSYKGLSAVMIPALCDTFRCITQDWRFGVKDIPMIPVVYPQNRSIPAAADFLVSEFEAALVRLSAVTGQTMTEEALNRSIDIYNRHNAVMREFTQVANLHLDIITPRVRHAVMKSAFFYEKEEHTALMRQLIDALDKRPGFAFSGKKVVLTGIMAEPVELLDMLEENNIAVVADDLAQESRQYRTDIPSGGSALHRLAQQWMERKACSLVHAEHFERGELLADLCKWHGAGGVIACMMKFCDPEEYDLPTYKHFLEQQGISVLSIEVDPLNDSNEQARTRIQTFGELLAR